MGRYRLLLAYLVLFSHLSPDIWGFDVGAVAVISFLLLSGFVMTALIRKYYLSLRQVPAFYVDRLVRIAPQFLLYTTLTLIGVAFFKLHHDWLHSTPTPVMTILQFLIFPLNFYRRFPDMFLPQAWSLGLEAFFYMLFPFVLIFRMRKLVAITSLIVFLVAAYYTRFDIDLYGYRYLPGTFFIFICGSWMESPDDKIDRFAPWGIFVMAMALLLFQVNGFANLSTYGALVRRSVLLGLTIGIPLVFWLRKKGSSGRAGDLSYGVFLNHVLILAAVSSFMPVSEMSPLVGALVFILIGAIATIASYVSFRIVEEPFIRLRRNLRAGKATGFAGS